MNNRIAIVLWLALWVACGVVAAGFDNAYFQRKYPSLCNGRQDLGESMWLTIGGPLSLLTAFLNTGFGEYGWSLSPEANPRCGRSGGLQ